MELLKNRVWERRATIAVCPNSVKKQALDENAGLFGYFLCGARHVESVGILLKLG